VGGVTPDLSEDRTTDDRRRSDVPAHTNLGDLRPEHELLVLLTHPAFTREREQNTRDFIERHAAGLSWGDLIDTASRHQVMPMIARRLMIHRLTHDAHGTPLVPYRWIYADVYAGSRQRNLALADEYGTFFRALNAHGAEFAVRKGPALGEHVYHDIALRRISDLDILMRRADYATFAQVAVDHGYQKGNVAPNGLRIQPFTADVTEYWDDRLPHTSLPFAKVADRNSVEFTLLTCQFSLFQPLREDADILLRRSVPTFLYGEPARMLDPVDQVMDACIQTHYHATIYYYIERGRDLLLRTFVDLAMLIAQAPVDVVGALVERANRFDLGDIFHFALYHLDQVFADVVPAALLAAFQPANSAYLDEYGGYEGPSHRWIRTFPERLFDHRRADEITGRSEIPGKRTTA
jgi:hypothetical protein